MQKYKYWLHTLPEVGDAGIAKLLKRYGSEERVYNAVLIKDKDISLILDDRKGYEGRSQKVYDFTKSYKIDEEYRRMLNKGIRFITRDDVEYPERLKNIDNPPYALYVIGDLPADDIPSVAIIGARNCSEYGTFVANAFGESLSKAGINIISGMARGIDGISQRGALKVNGKTYAVLGCGVDVCYPESNLRLYNDIKKNGGIISIFPPETKPIKRQFPERNKIVAALADIILVVEAKTKSGTAITVDLALKMGKDIYAVPGRLTDRLSDGCNRLIKDGAGIALSPEDIIKEIALMSNLDVNEFKADLYRPKEDTGILKFVDSIPKSVDEIYENIRKERNDYTLSQTMCELVMLSIQGKLVQVGTGYFYKTLS